MTKNVNPPYPTIEKMIAHPMESIFNIEEGTTAITIPEPRSNTHAITVPDYDEKDIEIEDQFQEIFNKAMDAYDELSVSNEGVEVKYKARGVETCNLMLVTALNAAKEQARMKEHKDILRHKGGGGVSGNGNTITNNTMVVSTSEIIKQMAERKSPINNSIESAYGEVDDEEEEQKFKRKMQPKKNKQKDVDDNA